VLVKEALTILTEVNLGHGEYYQGGAGNLEGRYVNYFEIGHNAFEFLLDFGQCFCEESEGAMHTRIVTSPVYAKRLVGVLQQALSQYEESYGQVPDDPEVQESAIRGCPRQTPALKLV